MSVEVKKSSCLLLSYTTNLTYYDSYGQGDPNTSGKASYIICLLCRLSMNCLVFIKDSHDKLIVMHYDREAHKITKSVRHSVCFI